MSPYSASTVLQDAFVVAGGLVPSCAARAGRQCSCCLGVFHNTTLRVLVLWSAGRGLLGLLRERIREANLCKIRPRPSC